MSMENKLKLMSSDRKIFEVEECVVHEFQTLKNLILHKDEAIDGVIPLPDVCSEILAQVIKYCSYHVQCQTTSHENATISPEEIKQWDAEFMKVDYAMISGLINAATYLDIPGLLDLACQPVVDMIKGKSAEEIRRNFNVCRASLMKRKRNEDRE